MIATMPPGSTRGVAAPGQVTTMDWRVELDIFNGPLDLLLYLIKRDELDVLDIPIARITESYVAHLEVLRTAHRAGAIELDTIGDFLVMAATLMEIKSAMLLPTPPPVENADGSPSVAEQLADPRADLIRQLLEYKRFKDHASVLERQQAEFRSRFPRFPTLRQDAANADEPPPLDLDEVQIWDLLRAFTRLMGEIGTRRTTHEVVDDDTPIELHAADVEDRLQRDGAQTLRQLFVNRRSRGEVIGVFLALLELIREKRVVARFADNGEDLALEIAPEEHRKTFRGASLNLSDEAASDEASADDETLAAVAADLAEPPDASRGE
jgi:segregation and condensation protein A